MITAKFEMLGNPRVRAAIVGSIGGFAGALISQVLVGIPKGTGGTLMAGCLVGVAIASLLGSADVLRSGTTKRLWNTLMISVIIGGLGGVLGASFGQVGFRLARGSPQENASSDLSMFSTEIRERLEEAGAKHGTVQFSLAWENKNDLDLHVIDPSGFEIFFGNKRSTTGGELDIDRNINFSDATNSPIEHVVWPADTAPKGEYQVGVILYSDHIGAKSTSFTVQALIDGKLQDFKGDVSSTNPVAKVASLTRADKPEKSDSAFDVFANLVARILSWLVFGAIVGSAQGAIRGSQSAVLNAVIGGAVGGAMGGLAFELVAKALVPLGIGDGPSRLIGFAILGACIGLFVAIIQRALSAVLKVKSGRFEGREILIDRKLFSLGRNEMLPGYLGGEDQIVGHHADIETTGNQHFVVAIGGDISVNEVSTKRQKLGDYYVIRLGKTRLVYLNRRAANVKGAGEIGNRSNTNPTTPPPPPPGTKKKPPVIPDAQKSGNLLPPSGPSRNDSQISGINPPPPPPKRNK